MQTIIETEAFLRDTNFIAKNKKIDLSQAEQNEWKATLAALANAYRRRKQP